MSGCAVASLRLVLLIVCQTQAYCLVVIVVLVRPPVLIRRQFVVVVMIVLVTVVIVVAVLAVVAAMVVAVGQSIAPTGSTLTKGRSMTTIPQATGAVGKLAAKVGHYFPYTATAMATAMGITTAMAMATVIA